MAGEQLLGMINSRGGNPSDYMDLCFGKVLSVEPLEVQYTPKMILTGSQLLLGRHVSKYKVLETYFDTTHAGDIKRTEEVVVDETLKIGDRVVMIRLDGGQQFYILEKTELGEEHEINYLPDKGGPNTV